MWYKWNEKNQLKWMNHRIKNSFASALISASWFDFARSIYVHTNKKHIECGLASILWNIWTLLNEFSIIYIYGMESILWIFIGGNLLLRNNWHFLFTPNLPIYILSWVGLWCINCTRILWVDWIQKLNNNWS